MSNMYIYSIIKADRYFQSRLYLRNVVKLKIGMAAVDPVHIGLEAVLQILPSCYRCCKMVDIGKSVIVYYRRCVKHPYILCL